MLDAQLQQMEKGSSPETRERVMQSRPHRPILDRPSETNEPTNQMNV